MGACWLTIFQSAAQHMANTYGRAQATNARHPAPETSVIKRGLAKMSANYSLPLKWFFYFNKMPSSAIGKRPQKID